MQRPTGCRFRGAARALSTSLLKWLQISMLSHTQHPLTLMSQGDRVIHQSIHARSPTAGIDVCRYFISQQCMAKIDVYSTNLAEWLCWAIGFGRDGCSGLKWERLVAPLACE